MLAGFHATTATIWYLGTLGTIFSAGILLVARFLPVPAKANKPQTLLGGVCGDLPARALKGAGVGAGAIYADGSPNGTYTCSPPGGMRSST